MNCPNCQTLCGASDRFCYICGTALQQEMQPPTPKKGTRWIPLLLLIVMSVTGLILFFATADYSAPVRAAHGGEDNSWFYVDNGVLYFEASRYTGSSELLVPSQIDGETVYALGEDCFAFCTDLTAVFLPDTLTLIGDGAFYGCSSMRGIYIPASVGVIGEDAFYGCANLEAVCLHDSINEIQPDAFDDCSYLGYIIFLGRYDDWTALYDEFINPYVGVFCTDGSYYQGGYPYE